MKNYHQHGYIALISALIISAVLLTVSVSLGMLNFFTRFSVLDAEYKVRSQVLAESCARVALLRLAHNPSTATTGAVSLGSDSCSIVIIQNNVPMAGQTTIQTKAMFRQSVTNFHIVASTTSALLVSWQELPNL